MGDPGSDLPASGSQAPARSQLDSEEHLLQRIYELEQLLAADKNQAMKFQKPKLQQVWTSELQVLLGRLG